MDDLPRSPVARQHFSLPHHFAHWSLLSSVCESYRLVYLFVLDLTFLSSLSVSAALSRFFLSKSSLVVVNKSFGRGGQADQVGRRNQGDHHLQPRRLGRPDHLQQTSYTPNRTDSAALNRIIKPPPPRSLTESPLRVRLVRVQLLCIMAGFRSSSFSGANNPVCAGTLHRNDNHGGWSHFGPQKCGRTPRQLPPPAPAAAISHSPSPTLVHRLPTVSIRPKTSRTPHERRPRLRLVSIPPSLALSRTASPPMPRPQLVRFNFLLC